MMYAVFSSTPIQADSNLISELAALTGTPARQLAEVLYFGGQVSQPASKVEAEQLARQLEVLGIKTEIKIATSRSQSVSQQPQQASRATVAASAEKPLKEKTTKVSPLGLILIISTFIIILAFIPNFQQTAKPSAGMLAPENPIQLDSNTRPWLHDDYLITPLASYELAARVLSTKRYKFSRGASLSPVDAALGWGPMSDTSVLDELKVSQRNRWYFVNWSSSPPLSSSVIMQHSANTHLVPSSPSVAKQIKRLQEHDVVYLKGYLVDISATDGFRWQSSTSRLDTGDGACELFWVEAITLNP